MEIKQLVLLIQRWSWLLIAGLLVGTLAGYGVSRFQDPTYQATTQLLVSRNAQNENSSFAGLNNQQLAMTYVQIIKTKDLRDETSQKIGAHISPEQVSVQLVPDTQVIEISVQDHDPELAAQIANTMVLILVEENEAVQSGHFAALESSLNSQITQVEEQIVSLQSEYNQTHTQNYQDQLSKVDEQITAITTELSTLQTEIASLSNAITLEQMAKLAALESQATQLESNLRIYNEIRATLLVYGKPVQSSQNNEDPQLQQLKSTIDLYQQMYLNILSSLESTRLARLQQTPNVVQIEKAFVPENPIRPNILFNSLISGIVGFALVGAGVLFFEMLEPEIRNIAPPTVEPKKKTKKKVEDKLENVPN